MWTSAISTHELASPRSDIAGASRQHIYARRHSGDTAVTIRAHGSRRKPRSRHDQSPTDDAPPAYSVAPYPGDDDPRRADRGTRGLGCRRGDDPGRRGAGVSSAGDPDAARRLEPSAPIALLAGLAAAGPFSCAPGLSTARRIFRRGMDYRASAHVNIPTCQTWKNSQVRRLRQRRAPPRAQQTMRGRRPINGRRPGPKVCTAAGTDFEMM